MLASRLKIFLLSLPLLVAGCGGVAVNSRGTDGAGQGADGPTKAVNLPQRQDGGAVAGKTVFRFETFGNEGFWTDAVRMPAGIKAAKVTPLQALQLGLSFDADALDATMRDTLAQQLAADPTGTDLTP